MVTTDGVIVFPIKDLHNKESQVQIYRIKMTRSICLKLTLKHKNYIIYNNFVTSF